MRHPTECHTRSDRESDSASTRAWPHLAVRLPADHEPTIAAPTRRNGQIERERLGLKASRNGVCFVGMVGRMGQRTRLLKAVG
jgi:hypothetical protein